MEVRPRHGVGSNEPYRNNCNDSPSNNISFDHYERDHSSTRSSPMWRRIKREAQCTLKTFVDILTGRASKFTYVLAPVLFALFWVLICIITGSRSVSLHDRLVQSKRVSYKIHSIATLDMSIAVFYQSHSEIHKKSKDLSWSLMEHKCPDLSKVSKNVANWHPAINFTNYRNGTVTSDGWHLQWHFR